MFLSFPDFYDASYISRIRNGNRQPANPEEFLSGVTTFVVRRCHKNPQRALVANLIGCKSDDLKDPDIYKALLFEWLTTGSANTKNYMKNFLEKLDEFNLDEYIRAIHFNELKVPSVPFQLPTSKNYFGLKEGQEITPEMWNYAKKYYTKDMGFDNNMTEWFQGVKNIPEYLKWLNKNSPAIAIPIGNKMINDNDKTD